MYLFDGCGVSIGLKRYMHILIALRTWVGLGGVLCVAFEESLLIGRGADPHGEWNYTTRWKIAGRQRHTDCTCQYTYVSISGKKAIPIDVD